MNYKNYNDYELIYMVRENDEDSSDILLKKYEPIIKKISNEYYLKFSKYGYDYEDFLQEAYISFYKAISNYDDKVKCLFYTFVVMCIRRGLISFCRKITCGKKNLSYDNFVEIEKYEIADCRSDVSSKIDKSEINRIIHDFINNLSFDDSNIFELRYNNFTFSEISILLDIPINIVEYRYRKSCKQLKTIICNYNN